MNQEPLSVNATYQEIDAALIQSETAIMNIFEKYLIGGKPLTHADFFGMGVGRRSLAMSAGFRVMIENNNSLCALPIVRMQLDTVLRLYAGFFAQDHQKFCEEVFHGKEIRKIKSDENKQMNDDYLLKRVAKVNPWMIDVYKQTSSYIHFSDKHILESLRPGKITNVMMVIGATDIDRSPDDFREPMRCIHHLNILIEFALEDWFARMCDPRGILLSAHELWIGDK